MSEVELTTDKLRKLGMSIPDQCKVCLAMEECTGHLFLECELVRWIWNTLLNDFGYSLCWKPEFIRNILDNRKVRFSSRILILKVVIYARSMGALAEKSREFVRKREKHLIAKTVHVVWSWIKFDPVVKNFWFEELLCDFGGNYNVMIHLNRLYICWPCASFYKLELLPIVPWKIPFKWILATAYNVFWYYGNPLTPLLNVITGIGLFESVHSRHLF